MKKMIELVDALTAVTSASRERILERSKGTIDESLHTIKSYKKTIKDYKSTINRFKLVIKEQECLIKSIKNSKPENLTEALDRIKKLKFVSSVKLVVLSREYFSGPALQIKTKNLVLKGSDPPDFIAGPYLIQLLLDGRLKVVRERFEKYNLNSYYHHCYISNSGEVCFGGNYNKFNKEIAFGRYDLALTTLWDMLSDVSDTSDGYIGYHSLIDRFALAELKIAESEKQKEKEKEVKKTCNITGMSTGTQTTTTAGTETK